MCAAKNDVWYRNMDNHKTLQRTEADNNIEGYGKDNVEHKIQDKVRSSDIRRKIGKDPGGKMEMFHISLITEESLSGNLEQK